MGNGKAAQNENKSGDLPKQIDVKLSWTEA